MMHNSIYFYSGPVHTGKTTRLNQWVNLQNSVDGILAPIFEGYRHIKRIATGESLRLEMDSKSEMQEVITVGQYSFSESVFSWARKQLLDAMSNKPEWLIIDEIGPLELRNEGLEPAVTEILHSSEDDQQTKIVLVIRERILNEVLMHYKVEKRLRLEFPE